MAAWVDGRPWLGVEECPAWRATPGRAWPMLAPWRKGMDAKELGETLRRLIEGWREYGLISLC
jgi:hypothetical protein